LRERLQRNAFRNVWVQSALDYRAESGLLSVTDFDLLFLMARDIKKRNQLIVRMSREGVPQAEIARQFRLSAGNIGLIVRKAEEDRKLADKSARLSAEIRDTDDLDKLWPTGELIDVLTLPAGTKKIILKAWEEKAQISLRDLMDLGVSETDDQQERFAMTPILRLRGIGKKNFRSFIDRVTELDLGRRCNAEWQWRMQRLSQAGWIDPPRSLSWSRPTGRRPESVPDGIYGSETTKLSPWTSSARCSSPTRAGQCASNS
jgi:transcriptional regulator